jgi:DNA replication protein DnaC
MRATGCCSRAATLIGMLNKERAENRLEEKLRICTEPQPLIVDEIGYLPIDRVGANLFIQLISRRSGRGPMILLRPT